MAPAVTKRSFVAPKSVQQALKRGLDLKDEYGGKGLQAHTIDWAKRLSAGDEANAPQIRRMRAWFHRHQADKKPGWDKPPTPGYVAFLLWGGEAGRKWVERLGEAVDKQQIDANTPAKSAKRPPARKAKKKAAKKKTGQRTGTTSRKKTTRGAKKKASKRSAPRR